MKNKKKPQQLSFIQPAHHWMALNSRMPQIEIYPGAVVTKDDIRRRLARYSYNELKGLKKITISKHPSKETVNKLKIKNSRIITGATYGEDDYPERFGEIEIFADNIRDVVGDDVKEQRHKILYGTLYHELLHHRAGHSSRKTLKNEAAENRLSEKEENFVRSKTRQALRRQIQRFK